MSDPLTPLAGRLRDLRAAAGLTQADAAKRASAFDLAVAVSPDLLRAYEDGRACPPLPKLRALAAVYSVDFAELCELGAEIRRTETAA